MTHRPLVSASSVSWLRPHVLDALLASMRGMRLIDLVTETRRRANHRGSFSVAEVEASIYEMTREGELNVYDGRWMARRAYR